MAVLSLDPNGFPDTLVNGATGTGTTESVDFTIAPRAVGRSRLLMLQLIPTGIFSAFTVDLEASLDGGVTWGTQQSAIDLQTGPAVVDKIMPGAQYRLSVASFTGGTSAVVLGSSS